MQPLLRLIVIILFCLSFLSAKSEVKDLDKIEQELILAKDDTSRAKLLNDAAFLLRTTNPKLSLKYANIAMELSIKTSYKKGMLNSYLVKGIIYKHFGDYETSMQNYVFALQISEIIGDTTRISSCYNNIGSIYQAQNNFTKAIFYFKKSLEIEKVLGKKDQVSIRLYNLGTVYESMNKLDSAYFCYNQSLLIEESLDNDEGISFALYGIGGVLTKKGEYSKAETYLKKAYDLALKNKDISSKSYCLNELGVLYMKWKKSDLAISYFLKSISCADSLEEKNQIKESYHNLALTYADLAQYKNAYEYFSKYNILNEEINNSDISRKIAEINTKYEVDKVDREMELIKKEARIKELEFNQQKNLRNYLLFTTIIVIVLAFFNYSSRKKTEKKRSNSSNNNQENNATPLFERLIYSKVAWAVTLGLYSVIYTAFVQPFGLALLNWSDKWLIIGLYGAISLVVFVLSFIIIQPWNEYFRKNSLILKYTLLAIINIFLLTFSIFFFNSLQELNDLIFSSLIDIFFQVIIISLLPIIVLILFSERITYAQHLKNIPEVVAMQQIQQQEIISDAVEEKQITIKTDNVGESIKLQQNQIICFEANDNYTAIYYLVNNKVKKELYRITLKKLEVQLFEFKEIIRCHKSYIINISHLDKISGNAQGFKMHLRNLDFEIPVSRSFPRQIIDNLREITLKKSTD